MFHEFTVNQRKWSRAAVQLPAQYFIKGLSFKYRDCTIINISRKGAGVLFPFTEQLKEKTAIFFDFIVPKTSERLSVKGELKNKNSRHEGLVGGIEFVSLLPEEIFGNLAKEEA